MTQNFLDKLFIKARSHYNWKNKDIDKKTLKDLYNLIKNCPTSANSEPMRIIFLKSKKSKERIMPFLSEGNVEKTMTAPVVAIIAYDSKFYEHIPFIKDKLGIKPPVMSPALEDKLCNLFLEVQRPYAKHCPDGRVNFLNYYYVLFKLCELLDETSFLEFFPMLKDPVKRIITFMYSTCLIVI